MNMLFMKFIAYFTPVKFAHEAGIPELKKRWSSSNITCCCCDSQDELVYEDGAPRSEYSEDSNSEGWYGNDYPDEEDGDSDAPQVPSSSEDYNVSV